MNQFLVGSSRVAACLVLVQAAECTPESSAGMSDVESKPGVRDDSVRSPEEQRQYLEHLRKLLDQQYATRGAEGSESGSEVSSDGGDGSNTLGGNRKPGIPRAIGAKDMGLESRSASRKSVMQLARTGTPEELARVDWLRESPRISFTMARTQLATRYLEGIGLDVDEAKAIELFKQSASEGNVMAKLKIEKEAYLGSPAAVKAVRDFAVSGDPDWTECLGVVLYREGIEADDKTKVIEGLDYLRQFVRNGTSEDGGYFVLKLFSKKVAPIEETNANDVQWDLRGPGLFDLLRIDLADFLDAYKQAVEGSPQKLDGIKRCYGESCDITRGDPRMLGKDVNGVAEGTRVYPFESTLQFLGIPTPVTWYCYKEESGVWNRVPASDLDKLKKVEQVERRPVVTPSDSRGRVDAVHPQGANAWRVHYSVYSSAAGRWVSGTSVVHSAIPGFTRGSVRFSVRWHQ